MDSTSSTQNALLPCPFCGKEPTPIGFHSSTMGNWPLFACRNNKCPASGCGVSKEQWNKRAAPSVSDGGSSDVSRVSLQKQIESLLAACKAKDDILNKIRTDWFGDDRETVRLCDEALALQPDSSVKPEESEILACLKLMLSVNGGFRLTAKEFERCQAAAGITGVNRAGTMRPAEVLYEGDRAP